MFPEEPPPIAIRYWKAIERHFKTGTVDPPTRRQVASMMHKNDSDKSFSESTIDRARNEHKGHTHPEFFPKPHTIQRWMRPPWETVPLKPLDLPTAVTESKRTIRMTAWFGVDHLLQDPDQNFCDVFEFTRDELVGKPVRDTLRPPHEEWERMQPEITRKLEALRSGTSSIENFWSWVLTKHGHMVWVEATVTWDAERQRWDWILEVSTDFVPWLHVANEAPEYHVTLEATDPQGMPCIVELITNSTGALRMLPKTMPALVASLASIIVLDAMDGKIDGIIHWCLVLAHLAGLHGASLKMMIN